MPMEKKTNRFDVVSLEDGELVAMDGGTHGVPGHTVWVLPDGTARWERRVDSMGDDDREGEGIITPDAGEKSLLTAWANAAWNIGNPERPWPPPAPDGNPAWLNPVPPWVWAVLVRRGDEIRIVEGDTWTGAPPELEPLLDWMATRIDETCGPR